MRQTQGGHSQKGDRYRRETEIEGRQRKRKTETEGRSRQKRDRDRRETKTEGRQKE